MAIVDNMINIPSLLINGHLPFWKQSLKLYIGGHKMYIYPFCADVHCRMMHDNP